MAGDLVSQVRDLEHLQQFVRLLAMVFHSIDLGENEHVLPNLEIRRKPRVRGREIGPLENLDPMTLQVLAENRDCAARGLDQAEQDLDGRRLARAVGAEDPDDFPVLHRERHVGYGHGAVEFFAKMLNVDKCFGHARVSPGYEDAGAVESGSPPSVATGAGSGDGVGAAAGSVEAGAGFSVAFAGGASVTVGGGLGAGGGWGGLSASAQSRPL